MKNYYKISLYDDYDTPNNRKLLRGILKFKFFNEEVLNKLLTDLDSPFLLTAIAVAEYNSDDDEIMSFVTWSELNERLKHSIKVTDRVTVKTAAIHQKSQTALNGMIGTVKNIINDNNIEVTIVPFGVIQFSINELIKH